MFSVPRGSVRGSHERMVIEIMAALQMSLCVAAPAIVPLLQMEGDVVSRSGQWTLQGWFPMVLWWTPCLCDIEDRTRQRVLVDILTVLGALVFWRRRSEYLCKRCTVWSRDTHTSHCGILRYIVQTCWCAYECPSDDPCYIRTVSFLWWTPYHQDLRGPRWQMMIGMVVAIHVSFHWQSQSSPLCWKQLHIGTVQFRDENRTHHQDFWRTFAHEFGWHEVFFCLWRGLHTCKTFPPSTWFAWWHFVQLSCVCSWAIVRLVVALCVLVENLIPPWCVRGALSEAWNHMVVVLPFRCLRRGPSVDQCYICIEWLCGAHESPWRLQEVCT